MNCAACLCHKWLLRCFSFCRIKRRRTTGKLNIGTAATNNQNNFDDAYELTAPPPRYEELPLESKLKLMTDEEMIGRPLESVQSQDEMQESAIEQPHEAAQVIDEDEEQEIAEEPVYVNVGKKSCVGCLVDMKINQ